MPQHTLAKRVRLLIPLTLLTLAALACNLGAQPPNATNTPGGTVGQTQVAQSDVPEVEIKSPTDGSEVVIQTEVQVYVHASDRVGVTRIEMRVDNLIVDTAASPEALGAPSMDSLLSWTPNSVGPHVVQVVAFRGNTKGNPKSITLTVRQNAAQITKPASSPVFLTASPTTDPTCRARVNVAGLNVRRGPGINYDSLTTLSPEGITVAIIGTTQDRSWWEVNVNGLIGWVSAAYTTQQGICTNIISVPIPASPTVQPGSTAIIIPPTFTALPTLPPLPPTSTIQIVILPTLTWTPVPTQGPNQPSIGDLSSTAIFATQTKLAQPPTATPTFTGTPTTAPGITATIAPTATITQTPSLTPTPQLPNLVVSSVETTSTTIVLDPVQKLATVPFIVKVQNIGDAPAPVFQVTVEQPDGTRVSANTTIVLNPKSETELTLQVPFTKEGPERIVVIADSGNAIVESNETDNVTFKDVNVVVATSAAPTATYTASAAPTTAVPTTVVPATTAAATTAAPTVEATTAVPPTLVVPTTEVATAAATTAVPTTEATTAVPTTAVPTTAVPTTEVATVAPTTAVPPTTQCPQPTPEQVLVDPVTSPTDQLTQVITVHINNGETVTITGESGTFQAAGDFSANPAQVQITLLPNTTHHLTVAVTVRSTTSNGCTYPGYSLTTTTDRNGAPLVIVQQTPTQVAVVPTATFTETPVPPTATFTETPIPPTATFTETPVPPTATFTETPIPPTATFTETPVPPTAVPPTETPVPPTATPVPPTETPIPPTATFTETPVPPTAVPPTETPVPPTAVPPTQAPITDMLTIPVVPNLNDQGVLARIRQINATGKNNGVVSGDFRLVGDTTLSGVANIADPTSNLGTTHPELAAAAQFFAAGITSTKDVKDNLSSADILNPAKGTGTCQNKAPLACALEAKPATILISVGRSDIAANIPLDQFQANLKTAIDTAAAQGTIPVLVTISGVNGADAKVAEYNNAIYELAKAENIPLFNLYGIKAQNPALIDASGNLSVGPNKADFSDAGLQFGENVANLHILQLFSQLQTAVPLS